MMTPAQTAAEPARKRVAANSRAVPKATPGLQVTLDLQIKSHARHVPTKRAFMRWIQTALAGRVTRSAELTLRVVGPTEMRALNREYRGKDYATNVLSFPFETPKGVLLPVQVLGDIVLCAQTVQREAKEQGKTVEAHWAHLTLHGVLHLLGLDHQTKRHAAVMEGAEIAALAQLGYANPYITEAP